MSAISHILKQIQKGAEDEDLAKAASLAPGSSRNLRSFAVLDKIKFDNLICSIYQTESYSVQILGAV